MYRLDRKDHGTFDILKEQVSSNQSGFIEIDGEVLWTIRTSYSS